MSKLRTPTSVKFGYILFLFGYPVFIWVYMLFGCAHLFDSRGVLGRECWCKIHHDAMCAMIFGEKKLIRTGGYIPK